jgi:hypothetical protein
MPFSLLSRLSGYGLLLAWTLVGCGCASQQPEPPASQSVDVSSGRARFVGPIDWDAVHRLQSLVKGKKIRILEVDSRGGNTEAAIALGTGSTSSRSTWRFAASAWAAAPTTGSPPPARS